MKQCSACGATSYSEAAVCAQCGDTHFVDVDTQTDDFSDLQVDPEHKTPLKVILIVVVLLAVGGAAAGGALFLRKDPPPPPQPVKAEGPKLTPKQQHVAALTKAHKALQESKFGIALGHYHAALAVQPDSSHANLGIGRCQVELGRAKLGVKYLKAAAEKEPENAEVMLWLGTAYFDLGDKKEAHTRLNAFIKKHPEHPAVASVKKDLAKLK